MTNSDFTNSFSRGSKINSRRDFHAESSRDQSPYCGERITAISNGSRYFHGERYGSRRLTKAGRAPFRVHTNLSSRGRRAVNNKLYQFVSRTRTSGHSLRGWRVACVFQSHRSTRSGWQRRGRKRSRGGRDVRDRKALAKRKVVHQTDEPVDAQMRFNVSPRLHV